MENESEKFKSKNNFLVNENRIIRIIKIIEILDIMTN